MTEPRPAPRLALDWRAALYAGVAAGIIATAAQLLLWWSFWDALPGILFRDARLAAAMVMGRGVLPPPATLDWTVMAVATLIHFALSVAYSAVLALVIARCGMAPAVAAGAGCGLVLYAVNMYGFTLVFPWFSAARDWITLVTHGVFGASAAACYKLWSRPC